MQFCYPGSEEAQVATHHSACWNNKRWAQYVKKNQERRQQNKTKMDTAEEQVEEVNPSRCPV